MAYTAFTGKIIKHRYGAVRVTLAEAVEVGDLITRNGYLADSEDSKQAVFIACQSGIALAEIWAAMAVEIMKPATIGAQGVPTRGNHGGTVGAPLYLNGTAVGNGEGEAGESQGSGIVQLAGYVTSQDCAMLCPGQVLTTTNLSLTGTLAVAEGVTHTKTLAQVGIATFTATPVFNGGGTITAGQFFSGAPLKFTRTSKSGNAALTAAEAGIILVTADGKTMTLPAVATSAGIRYIIKQTAAHAAGTNVDGNASETIDGDTDLTCGAQFDVLDIVCDGSAWHIIGQIGTWS